MSDAPRVVDVVIRSRLATGSAEFVVYIAGSDRLIGGPFASLADAVDCALAQTTQPARLFYEAFDERGRAIGAPMRLRLERHEGVPPL